MVPTVGAARPGFERLLLGGLVAGAISACANNVYFMVYRWATDFYDTSPRS